MAGKVIPKWVAGAAVVAIVLALSTALALLAGDRSQSGSDGADATGNGLEATDAHDTSDGNGSDDPAAWDPQGTAADPGEARPLPDDGSVVIRLSSFWTVGITVSAGATLTVVNDATPPQSFTASDGSFDTGELRNGESAVITAPSRPGTYTVVSTSAFGEHNRGNLVVR